MIVQLFIIFLCIGAGVWVYIYYNNKANQDAKEYANKVCKWTHDTYSSGNNTLCVTGNAKCWIANLSMDLSAILGDCNGDSITMSNLQGNVSGVSINTPQWKKTSEWDPSSRTLTLKKYAGDHHRTMWASNNDGEGFGDYKITSGPVKQITIDTIGLSDDVPPKMTVGVKIPLPIINHLNCTSDNPLTQCPSPK